MVHEVHLLAIFAASYRPRMIPQGEPQRVKGGRNLVQSKMCYKQTRQLLPSLILGGGVHGVRWHKFALLCF